jgi:hypothetical protein
LHDLQIILSAVVVVVVVVMLYWGRVLSCRWRWSYYWRRRLICRRWLRVDERWWVRKWIIKAIRTNIKLSVVF